MKIGEVEFQNMHKSNTDPRSFTFCKKRKITFRWLSAVHEISCNLVLSYLTAVISAHVNLLLQAVISVSMFEVSGRDFKYDILAWGFESFESFHRYKTNAAFVLLPLVNHLSPLFCERMWKDFTRWFTFVIRLVLTRWSPLTSTDSITAMSFSPLAPRLYNLL